MRNLLIFSLALIASLGQACGAAPAALAQQDLWKITRSSSGVVRYITHGSRVHTHEFGFTKRKGSCETDTLWLTLSSTDPQVTSLRGSKVRLPVSIDDTRFELTADLRTTRSLAARFKVAVITGLAADRQLIERLGKGRKITVAVGGPPKAAQMLAGSEEEFGLAGFTEARDRAETLCNG